jgi:hypothetical protein
MFSETSLVLILGYRFRVEKKGLSGLGVLVPSDFMRVWLKSRLGNFRVPFSILAAWFWGLFDSSKCSIRLTKYFWFSKCRLSMLFETEGLGVEEQKS